METSKQDIDDGCGEDAEAGEEEFLVEGETQQEQESLANDAATRATVVRLDPVSGSQRSRNGGNMTARDLHLHRGQVKMAKLGSHKSTTTGATAMPVLLQLLPQPFPAKR